MELKNCRLTVYDELDPAGAFDEQWQEGLVKPIWPAVVLPPGNARAWSTQPNFSLQLGVID